MAKESVTVEVYRRKFTVERPDIDPLIISAVAKKLEERMREIEHSTGTFDSSRLAIMTALDLACDLEKAQLRLDAADQGQERRLEEMIVALERALAPAKKP